MRCPKCEFDNPESAKFCNSCGNKLELACPRCENINPPGSRFCNECGHDLTTAAEPAVKPLSFDEKLEKLQRYLPKDLTEKILAQRGKIEGERRQVTVMFCDVEGFTPLSEKLGEERIYSITDDLFEMMIHKVHDYGGTVNRGTGDGIMALFGTPIAVEDAPQRAIRSALAIQREMTGFSRKLREESEAQPLKMRIGIHTGPVVVGTLGNDLRVEFTAVGDTVNLASRMEGLAQPGAVYVTEDTFKLTEGYFRFEALGERQVKGKESPVKAYRVIAPSGIKSRFDVSAERGLTPFVGREKELELLLDGLERARTGRGQAFSIMGEAGVGKSRLLYEFRKAIGSEDVTFLEGRCLSYDRGVAYHPIIEILKSNFSVLEGDKDYQVKEKVKRWLKQSGLDEVSTLPYVLELLGVRDSGIDKISMSPEGKKDRMIEAVKRISLKGSERRPLIWAIEDLHWIDRSCEEAMKYLLEGIPGARILFIFTYRPEFVHAWGSKSYHSQVTLNKLSNRESLSMFAHLLGTDEIETPLQELLLEKTEGIPFFIEEFIKSLQDLKIIEKKDATCRLCKDSRDVTIPGTIQDVIMARVDSLPDVARGVLQTGSAIEREFGFDLIQRVTGIAERELLSHLSVLKDSELLYERGIYPQSTYVFRHALTREVIYSSILARRKKKLHVEIANAIEQGYKENLDEHYEVLAEHYVTGEDYAKGAEYCRLAADKTEAVGSLSHAIAYCERELDCLERLPWAEDVERSIIDTRTTIGLYDLHMSHLAEAREAVEPIVDLAVKRNFKREVSQIYTILGHCASHIDEDYLGAFKYLEDALKIAEELNDIPSLVAAHNWLGIAASFNCEFEKGLYHLEKALEINVAANNLWAIAAVKSQMTSNIYIFGGKTDLAYKTGGEAVRTAEESGDIFSKAMAYTMYGGGCLHKGFLEEAEEYLLKGLDFAERTDHFVVGGAACWWLGDIYYYRAEYRKSQEWYQRALTLSERSSIRFFISLGRILVAKGKVMNNQKDIDLNEIFMCYEENRTKSTEGHMARYIGEILLHIDGRRMDEAEEWVNEAIEATKRNGVMHEMGMSYTLYAELLKRKGDLPGAKEKLNNAIEIYRECGADGWLKKAQDDLVAIEKPERTRSSQKKARSVTKNKHR